MREIRRCDSYIEMYSYMLFPTASRLTRVGVFRRQLQRRIRSIATTPRTAITIHFPSILVTHSATKHRRQTQNSR